MYNMIPFGRHSSNLDNFFDDLERSFFPSSRAQMTAFRTDIRDNGDSYLLEADLPGFKKEDIDLDVKDGVLTISATHDENTEEKDEENNYLCRERRTGHFERSFDIAGINEEGITAAYNDGVLTLNLPKQVELPPQGRKISIG